VTEAVALHVYPWVGGLLPFPHPETEKHIGFHDFTHGLRATMVYIHGQPEDWEDDIDAEWLKESVFTKLIDDNPARVVWCHD
jgi:hypothetical protein